jgi:hypothetical protein
MNIAAAIEEGGRLCRGGLIIVLGGLMLAAAATPALAADPPASDAITTNLAGPWKLGDRVESQDCPPVAKAALVISAQVETAGTNGVILAQGGWLNGYALYLSEGKLALAIRRQGDLTTVTAGSPLGSARCRVEGRLAADGEVSLLVDGRQVATGRMPGLIDEQPVMGLTIGFNEPNSAANGIEIGDYPAPNRFVGKIENATVQTVGPALTRPAAATTVQTVTATAGVTELPVPKISEVARVDRNTPPSSQDEVTATYILKTSPHSTLGDAYVIVTDQTNQACLEPLERLAKFHQGSIVRVEDLGALRTMSAARERLTSDLRRLRPRFMGIAPQARNFTENTLLGMWSVLTALSDDRRLPFFPGILAASSPAALGALVDRSIHYQPLPAAQVRLFVMGQVIGPQPYGQRSLQKVRMMRNLFADYGCTTHSLVLLADSAVKLGVQVAPAPDQWQAAMSAAGRNIPTIPVPAQPALNDASLLLLFGHGSTDTECCLDVSAFREVSMTGKIVMSGNCFSAAPAGSKEGESFAMLAVDQGAVTVFAHLRENAGFPHLFPVLEGWMDGLTVGESYQRLINALMAFDASAPDGFGAASQSEAGANALLYVVIGDPALQPLVKMTPLKP